MTDEITLQPGDRLVPVQMSPCVGGLVRTWADDGSTQLWSMDDPMWMLGRQGHGVYARTLQEPRRYRECALLAPASGVLVIQSRHASGVTDEPDPRGGTTVEVEGQMLQLRPATEPTSKPFQELRWALDTAVRQCISSGEFLVVERGGWDSPQEPFALFILMDEPTRQVSVVETAPAPWGSEVWAPHIVPGAPSTTLSAPVDDGTLEVVPWLLLEAIRQWGLEPWDLALTFGRREAQLLPDPKD